MDWEYNYTLNLGGSVLYDDFFLKNMNLVIEYDGIQHYKETGFFMDLERQQMLDKRKNRFLEEENISLVRIKYNQKLTPDLVYNIILGEGNE